MRWKARLPSIPNQRMVGTPGPVFDLWQPQHLRVEFGARREIADRKRDVIQAKFSFHAGDPPLSDEHNTRFARNGIAAALSRRAAHAAFAMWQMPQRDGQQSLT